MTAEYDGATGQELRVLVLEASGPDVGAAGRTLRIAGFAVEFVTSFAALVECLESGAGAAVVGDDAFVGVQPTALSRWIDHEPEWSDFPFIVMASSPTQVPKDVNVRWLQTPFVSATLISAVAAALRDRTRQYRVRALERLRQGQKMEAIGLLTGGIAHDFNNLFTAVMGSLELIHSRTLEARTEQLASHGLAAVARGARLIRQLLTFSRIQQLELTAIPVSEFIAGMRDLLEASIPQAVGLQLDLEPAVPAAVADPLELETAILNLAANGCEAMPDGGILHIGSSARREMVDGVEMQVAVVSVTDTGHGMTTETMERAFEPFFTTKEIGRGSGLGLSQAYGLAWQAGGTVLLRSSPAGTRVELLLPQAAAHPDKLIPHHAAVGMSTPRP